MTRPSPAQIGRDSVAWGYRMQAKLARQHPWRVDEARRASLRAGRHVVRCQPVDVGLRSGPFNVAVHHVHRSAIARHTLSDCQADPACGSGHYKTSTGEKIWCEAFHPLHREKAAIDRQDYSGHIGGG